MEVEWEGTKETGSRLKFGNCSFKVKKSEDLAPVRVHMRRKGHASDSRLTEET